MFLRAEDKEYGLSYSSDDDLSSLVIDAESEMATFVAIAFRACRGCSCTNVLYLGVSNRWTGIWN